MKDGHGKKDSDRARAEGFCGLSGTRVYTATDALGLWRRVCFARIRFRVRRPIVAKQSSHILESLEYRMNRRSNSLEAAIPVSLSIF